MDQLTKLEQKIDTVLGYLTGLEEYDALEARIAAIDAEAEAPPPPDPLLVEVREVLRSLRERDAEQARPCWCRLDELLRHGHQGYCDRANALLAKLDARIGGR